MVYKRPEKTEEEIQNELRRIRLPKKDDLEQLGVISQLVGSTNIKVLCEDGKERICRIPGKMKKRVWMRLGDIVIVKLWDFQPSKGDVVWRYTEVQKNHLKRKGLLNNFDV